MIEIIAEAAQGFLGDPPAKTLNLAGCAAAAGADAVKFQLVYADELCTPDHKHFELFRSLEMSDEQWHTLADVCARHEVGLYLDIFGPASLTLAGDMQIRGIKLHSTDLLNHELLHLVAESPVQRVLLSTGGTYGSEINEAVAILQDKELVLIHGFQGYPTQAQDNQTMRIEWLKKHFPDAGIGFADHVAEGLQERFWLSALAIGAGANVLEKHITTALVLKEEDYESALSPDDFSIYAENMRLAAAVRGNPNTDEDFGMSESEQHYRHQMKKQVIAVQDIANDTLLGNEHLGLLRTSSSEDVIYDLRSVLGKRTKKLIKTGTAIKEGDIA